MKYIIYILLAFILASVAHAHQDPLGEVHPNVTVSNETFVVCFSKSNPPEWNRTVYQRLFDKSGTMVGNTVERPSGEYIRSIPKLPIILPEELEGHVLKSNTNSFIVVPNWHRKHDGKPFFLNVQGKKYRRTNVDWGKSEIDIVHSVEQTTKHLILLVTEIDKEEFDLVAIDKATGEIINRRTIGTPARIYNFSVSSNLLEFNNTIFVAWMKEGEEDEDHLMVSRWDLVSNVLHTSERTEEATWNTSLSMARIGGTALLAYHSKPDGVNGAKIITVKIDLTSE